MKHKIKIIKQTTEFGCLAVCYAMLKNYLFGEKVFTQERESQLTKEAYRSETGFNEHIYLKKLYDSGCELKILIETPYMEDGYNQLNTKLGCDVNVKLCMIDVKDFEKFLEEDYLIITLMDLWHVDMIIHYPHYIIMNGQDEDSFSIIDPKYGKEIKFSKNRFIRMINALKENLGYSPLIFAIKKKPQIY